jgi:hypothetical protein
MPTTNQQVIACLRNVRHRLTTKDRAINRLTEGK